MISKSMWHYDGVKEGHLDLSGEPVKALLASYVAFIAKKVDALETIGDSIEHEANDESLASLLSRGHVPSEVSNRRAYLPFAPGGTSLA
jgi:hypothetical protein